MTAKDCSLFCLASVLLALLMHTGLTVHKAHAFTAAPALASTSVAR